MLLVISTFVVFQFIYNLSFKPFLYFRYISGHLPSVLLIFTLLYFRSFAFWSSKSSILLLYFRSSAIFASSQILGHLLAVHLVIYIFVTFQVICNLCFKSSLYFFYISGHLQSVLQDISILLLHFRSSVFCSSSHLYLVLFQVICILCF